jgi:hypothetical protein
MSLREYRNRISYTKAEYQLESIISQNPVRWLLNLDWSSQEAWHEVMERAMRQYGYDNLGVDDELLEFCCALCNSDDDWRFLITQLELYPSDWNRSKILEILNSMS